jgi:hypothetical protein
MTEPEVFGDPEGMRALARAITSRADLVNGTPGGFDAALGAATFEGPAALRLRGAGEAARGGVAGVVAELHGLASALIGDADTVEQMNADAKAKAEADAAAEADGDATVAASAAGEAAV